jgi:ribosomal protein S18 acetylase RimI-like enzyme
MADLLIRDAEMSDLDELVKLRLSFQRHMEASNPRVWRITEEGQKHLREETEQMLANKDGRMPVAVKNGVIAGFTYGEVSHRTAYLPSTIGQISIIYVLEEFRRHGLGRQLVEELCRFFSSKNVEEVTLNYIIGNKEAEGFWEALGFEPIRISANLRFKDLEERLASLQQPLRQVVDRCSQS